MADPLASAESILLAPPQSAEAILLGPPSAEELLLGRKAPPVSAPPSTFTEGMLREAKRLVSLPLTTLTEEAAAGSAQVQRGLDRGLTLGAAADVLLGSLRTASSPLTAGLRTVADPASRLVQAATGMSEESRQSVQTGAEIAGGMLTSRVPLFRRFAPVTEPSPSMRPGPVSVTQTRPAAPSAQLAVRSGRQIDESLPLTSERVSVEMTAEIAQGAAEVLAGRVDQAKRLFRHVEDALGAGEIMPESLPGILARHGVTPTQFAQHYAQTVSESGRTLNQLSQLRKKLGGVFANEPAALKALDALKSSGAAEGGSRVVDLYRSVDNFRRAMLVTQWTTSIRNAITQAGRYTVGAVDDAFATLFEGRPLREALRDGLESFSAVTRRMTPGGRAQLQRVLDEFPAEAAKLAGTISGEANLTSQFSNFINPLNKAQEGFFRRLAFDARLHQVARANGKDLNAIRAADIPPAWIEQATRNALEITFAATPKAGGLGAGILDAYRAVPFLTLVNPFPRFTVNATRFLIEHSPAALASPTTLRALAAGGRPAAEAAAKITTGTAMLSTALALRGNDDLAGEKWYEIKRPGTAERADVRPFGPFSIYAMMAEGILRPEKLDVSDWSKLAVGINRIAGTGLIFLDAFREGIPIERQVDTFLGFVGQYLGGYSVPLRNLKSSIASFGTPDVARQERVYRDVRDHPIVGPLISSVPGISQTLPASVSPTSATTPMAERPILRQWAGVNVKTLNLVEQEINRLGLQRHQVMPTSGIPAWDREVASRMGPLVESQVPALIASERYDRLIPPVKRYLLKSVIGELRKAAVTEARKEAPELASQALLKGLDADLREALGIGLKGTLR